MNRSVLLEKLASFMAQEAETMSEEDLLEETGGRSGLAYARVHKLKRILEDGVLRARQRRLEEARARYAIALSARPQLLVKQRPPISTIREQIKSVFASQSEASLAVAWRNGEYQTDEDFYSLWDQLCELGAIEQKDVYE